MSILEFAEAINKVTGNQAGLRFRKIPAARATRKCASLTSPAQGNILNWEPKVDLEEGIRRTIPFFKEKLGLA
jgi:dTDP-glucose 4,6-dehydratase